MQHPLLSFCCLLLCGLLTPDLHAQEVLTDQNFIRIDQFGYPTTGAKVAVIARAQDGYNAGYGIALDPGQPIEVVREGSDEVVYSGPAKAWNGGSVDEVSGDKGYWYDFTSVRETGTFRIRLTKDDGEVVTSYPFRIADDVYDDVLRVAVEFFYYQRVNQEKTAEYASGAPWTDGAWFDRDYQEYAVKSLADSSQTRSMPKGWFDAGDPNKYVTFASEAVHSLLTTYDQYPDFWNDFSLRIPESGNDVPDLLDEIDWEIDWLMSMQDYDPTADSGSGGFYQKMGILEDVSYISPPSTDTRLRWYNDICVNSTITGAAMLAHAALSYQTAGVWPDKVAELRERAEVAWAYYVAAPNKTEQCDDGRIEAGDADGSGAHFSEEHLAEAAVAAAYLFALTGEQQYSDFVVANYRQTRPFVAGDWGVYRGPQAEAMLFYATLPDGDAATKAAILAEKTSAGKSEGGVYVVEEEDNLYRALPEYFNWGSNSLVSRQAANIMDFLVYDLKEENHAAYQTRAQSIINYLHGTNPSGIVMLSNMYRYGAELSADELWHSWFALGTVYDNIDGDNVGPAPGFLSGGPNPQGQQNMPIKLGTYSFNTTTAEQPDQKDFSVDNYWEYGPWAYNEPAIYYQANYIKALAHFVAGQLPALDTDVSMGANNTCYEAEDIFAVANETGGNGTVERDNFSPGSSGGASVKLFDAGDAATLTFTVAEAADFDLALRVRVGEQAGTATNLAGSYVLTMDGDTLDYVLDSTSVGELQQDTYWGEIVIQDISLPAGDHELTVAATGNYLKLDRLCLRDPGSVAMPEVEQAPYLGEAATLPGTIQAENYDLGGQGVAYEDSDASNNGGQYRPDEGVDIGGNEEDGYSVGWVSEGEYLEYTVDVTTPGVYQLSAALASPDGGGSFAVSFPDNGASTTLTVPAGGTGGFAQFQDVEAAGPLSLRAGTQVMRITIGPAPAFNIDSLVFTYDSTATGAGIVDYFDGLEQADSLVSGEPAGLTFGIDDGVLFIAGDGSAPAYQVVSYELSGDSLANVVASGNLLYIGARTASGAPANLRIDVIDDQNRHTTNGSVTRAISGADGFTEFVYDFSSAYQDGGYGGTGCAAADAPCPVDGTRIQGINFYPEAPSGGFNDTIFIDYLSFGRSISDVDTSDSGPTGMLNYADNFEDDGSDFSGTPGGLTYGVEDGLFFIEGDGTGGAYQTIDYRLRMDGEDVLADVVGSNNTLYLKARLEPPAVLNAGGTALMDSSVNLRIDLVDVNDYNTTNGGRSAVIEASDTFSVYTIDFTGGYQDGGYGGTGCSSAEAPCAVDGQRIAGLRFYPDPVTGGFEGRLLIDWISFGEDISTSVRDFAELSSLRLFPNPAAGAFTVAFGLLQPATVDVQLYDAFGRLVTQQRAGRLAAGEQYVTVDELGALSAGTYFLRLVVDGKGSRAVPVRLR